MKPINETVRQTVLDVLTKFNETIEDENYFIASVFATIQLGCTQGDDFERSRSNIFRFLDKYPSAETLLRERRMILSKNHKLKMSAQKPRIRNLFKNIPAPMPFNDEGEKAN